MQNWNKADSNRGGALLSVIIAMTVVGILGTLVLSISYTNFRMKQIDKKSKDNFYSAEAVLDEIFVGLQGIVSEQYKDAYTTIMENYGDYDTSEEIAEDFNREFVLNMVTALQSSAGDPEHYNIGTIDSLVNRSNYPSTDSFTVSSVVASTSVEGENVTYTYDNRLETLENCLSIRNLVVTYVNNGYVNTITTDIKISTPALEFAMISTMPEIADYIMIAQDGMATNVGAHYSLQGKAFTGKDIAGTGIELAAGSLFDVDNEAATLLVTEGDISVVGNSTFRTATSTSLWANSITASPVSGATAAKNNIALLGRTYIKDDTTLNGSSNVLKLGGQYYGYSNNDADASMSSAVIVNGAGTTLDMSELKTLVVAGTSFVATKGHVAEGNNDADVMNSADVLMGDSIAVKGNQIAYLVPTECKGIVSNPMSYDQYSNLIPNPEWRNEALNTVLNSMNRSLASYGNISIQPIYTARDGGTVYLYLSFTDADVASKYFMDYYGTDSGKKIQNYLNRYVSAFRFDETAVNRLVTQGNYLVQENENTATYAANTGDVATSAQELLNYQDSYKALCAKLVENKSSLTAEELDREVYENLIDQNAARTGKLDKFLDACRINAASGMLSDNITYTPITSDAGIIAGAEITIWANAEDKNDTSATNRVRCIIVDNDETGKAYTIPTTDCNGIIIATGDVYVSGVAAVAWNGLVISNGKIVLNGGSETNVISLRADGNATAKAMQYVCSVGAADVETATAEQIFSVMNFFIGGSEFSVGDSSNAEGAKVDVRDCLSYENWKSE